MSFSQLPAAGPDRLVRVELVRGQKSPRTFPPIPPCQREEDENNQRGKVTPEDEMSRAEQEDSTIYKVVVNHEEQYSIWPADRENAPGWSDVGKSGSKAECLAYIEEVWTDMRPLSLRRKMAEAAGQESEDN